MMTLQCSSNRNQGKKILRLVGMDGWSLRGSRGSRSSPETAEHGRAVYTFYKIHRKTGPWVIHPVRGLTMLTPSSAPYMCNFTTKAKARKWKQPSKGSVSSSQYKHSLLGTWDSGATRHSAFSCCSTSQHWCTLQGQREHPDMNRRHCEPERITSVCLESVWRRPQGRSYSWVPFQETGLTNSEAKHELWVDEAWDGKLCFPVSRTSSLSPLSFWGWTPSVFISGLNRPAHLNSADLLNNDGNNHNIHELTGAMVLVRQAGRGRGDLTEWGQSEVAVPDGWASNLNNFFGTDPKLYADEMPVLYILMLLVFRNIWHLRNVASC